jgi:hypothetical protein
MKKVIGLMSLAGLLISTAAWAQVINGGFEILSASYTTGALGWSNDSTAPAGTLAVATCSSISPFAGVEDLALIYTNVTLNPSGSPSVIAQSDIFPNSGGSETLTFEADGAFRSPYENNQVNVQWFGAGNAYLGQSGFVSYQSTLTGSYTLQSLSLTAPAGTTGALIQFLEAGSANPNDGALTLIDNVTIIPEPASIMLVAVGLLGTVGLIRRRK